MSVYLPPAPPGIVFPPPLSPPPRPPWSSPPPPPTQNNSKSAGGVIAGISIAVGLLLFLGSCMCALIRGQRQSGADAAAEAADLASPPSTAVPHQPRHSEQQLRGAALEGEPPRRASPTAGLPSFAYGQSSVKPNTTASGEEAAACSVCLGAFQTGETVRLLPVCLHLYHVECIDPWLDAHSSCPICRTGTDPAMDGGLLPPD